MSLLRDACDLSPAELDMWDQLAAQSDCSDPHCCGAAWQLTARDCFMRAKPPILLKQVGTSQIAFAVSDLRIGVSLTPLEMQWLFGSPLLGDDAPELLADTLPALADEIECDGLIMLVAGIPRGGRLERDLKHRFRPERIINQDLQIAASLDGGADGWLSRRSANFRKKLRQGLRQARDAGITFERVAPVGVAEADRLHDRMADVERRSWKGRINSGLFGVGDFYQQLLRAYAQLGAARVVMAMKDGRPIGFCFGGAMHGVYRGQQTSYDADYAANGVGTLMHWETMLWLCEDGVGLQHFGPVQNGMTYKYSFCEIVMENVALVLSR